MPSPKDKELVSQKSSWLLRGVLIFVVFMLSVAYALS
jgi:hypothetical protein